MKNNPNYWQNKLNKWYKTEQKKGLVDLKFDVLFDNRNSDTEQLCKEIYQTLIKFHKDKKTGKIKPLDKKNRKNWL